MEIIIALIILGSLVIYLLYFYKNNGMTTFKRDGEMDSYFVSSEDKEINEAKQKAQQTLDQFDEALNSDNPDFELFSLKVGFKAREGYDYIWLSGIQIKDGKYLGWVDNLPETTEVKQGDSVEVAREDIADWYYIDNRRMRGGFTTKALRNKMTEVERKKFDQQVGIIFED